MNTTLGEIGLTSDSSGESDDDLADATQSLVHDEAHDALMDTEDEADEEHRTGGDERRRRAWKLARSHRL